VNFVQKRRRKLGDKIGKKSALMHLFLAAEVTKTLLIHQPTTQNP
jgi:hypothetical protein